MRTALLLATATALALPAWADRPLTTNNADVHDIGACAVEAGVERSTARGAPSARGSLGAFACGLGLRTEAGLGYGESRAAGMIDHTLSLAGKTALVEGSDGSASWSLGWGVDWLSSGGSGTRREGSFVNGILTIAAAEGLLLHGNLGWAHVRSARQDTTNWGLALEKSLGRGLEIVGEVYGSDRDGSPWLNLGLRWAVVADRWFVDAAWAAQRNSARAKAVTLGLRAEF